MSNSVDSDETAHYEPSHLDLCCFKSLLLSPVAVKNQFYTSKASTSSVKHHSETHMITNTVMKQSKWFHGDLKPEQKKKKKKKTPR